MWRRDKQEDKDDIRQLIAAAAIECGIPEGRYAWAFNHATNEITISFRSVHAHNAARMINFVRERVTCGIHVRSSDTPAESPPAVVAMPYDDATQTRALLRADLSAVARACHLAPDADEATIIGTIEKLRKGVSVALEKALDEVAQARVERDESRRTCERVIADAHEVKHNTNLEITLRDWVEEITRLKRGAR